MDPKTKARLTTIVANDVAMLEEKGKGYGDSWRKRGGIGAFMNLSRKWDRLENICKELGFDVFNACTHRQSSYGSPVDENVLDTIRDLRGYLLLVEEHVLAASAVDEGFATGMGRFKTGDVVGAKIDLPVQIRGPRPLAFVTVGGEVVVGDPSALRQQINDYLGCTPAQFTGIRNPDHLRIEVDLRKLMALDTGAGGWAEIAATLPDKNPRTVDDLERQPTPPPEVVLKRLQDHNNLGDRASGPAKPGESKPLEVVPHDIPANLRALVVELDDTPPASALHPA